MAYFSVFGKVTCARAYFYTPGQAGKCPLGRALSWPERCYSDLLMESAELLAVDGAYDKAVQVLARLLEVDLPMAVVEQSQGVLAFYAQQAPFPPSEEGPILVAQADGKGVPLVRPPSDVPKVRRAKGGRQFFHLLFRLG